MRLTLEERFWRKVEKSDGECWLWTGSTNDGGYGRIWDGKDSARPHLLLAHRVSWEIATGVPPGDFEVCHSCDNPACVYPYHLFLATHAENVADMVSKGRQAVGERNARTKLTPSDVRRIRENPERKTQRALAAEYGVGKGTIQTILERRSWAYV